MLDKARLLILGLMGNTIVRRVSAESLGDRDSRARATLRGTGGGRGQEEGGGQQERIQRAQKPQVLPGLSLPRSLLVCPQAFILSL